MERQGNRIMAVRDGRNPYGSRGGYVVSSRGRRGSRRGGRRDRGMDYEGQDMRGSGSQYSMRRYRDMNEQDMRMRDYGDYERDMRGDMARGYDREGQDYGDMRMDGHYGMHGGRQSGYEPVEFMGYCSGYYGSPEQDYGYDMRGRGRDYGYDMARGGGRGRGRDYGDYNDYDYDYGDYGETLSEQELEHWCKKLKSKLTEQEKQMFSKEMISQKAKQMGIEFKDFTEMEFYVNTLKNLTDHKKSLGANPEIMVKLSRDDFEDDDGEYKGSEWLAVYYDDFVKKDD